MIVFLVCVAFVSGFLIQIWLLRRKHNYETNLFANNRICDKFCDYEISIDDITKWKF